jgi:hypothetical protein
MSRRAPWDGGKLAGLREPRSQKRDLGHPDFRPGPPANLMVGQLVDRLAHRASHNGGVDEFQRDTGLQYDTPEARREALRRQNCP